MSESELQRALLHLYVNIDRFGPYADELFESFALSRAELEVLDTLMTSQRDGLLLHMQLLLDKRRHLIVEALPASASLAKACLTRLLDSFHVREGVRDLADTMRAFADCAGETCSTAVTKDLELVRFEALHASIALRTASARRDSAILRCTYDAYEVMSSLSWSDASTPCCYFLFQARGDQVRVLHVSPRLADLLELFHQGLSWAEVLQTIENERDRAAADDSIKKLACAGALIE